jgi:hypothetical protein
MDVFDHARTFSTQQRQKLAKEGKALPDGSFPIVTKGDLRNAVQAYGRASNKSKARRHIIKRARALGATELLPESWDKASGGGAVDTAQKDGKKKGYKPKKDSGSLLECIHEGCDRVFGTEEAAEDHALAVHSHDEVRMAISKALRAKFAGPPRHWTYVVETADDWFVYSLETPGAIDDTLYRQGYSFSDGEATLKGEPVEVRRRTVYEPVKKEP